MKIKSSQTLVNEALSEIKTISPHEALDKINNNQCNLIDIRDHAELEVTGKIENSTHIPRGLLEFSLDPSSAKFNDGTLDKNKEIVLFCAAGARSALAAKTLQDIGHKNVSHIEGGFYLMKDSGFKII
tara:strand:+ start:265 stop:648 length:384 start_codon:yes stop_codon:yes gene_type:complete